MLAEGLMALAQLAGQTVVAAAVTDAWEAARHKFARLLGRGDPGRPSWQSSGWRRHASSSRRAGRGPGTGPGRSCAALGGPLGGPAGGGPGRGG